MLQVLSRLILIVWHTVGRLAAVTQKMLTLKGALDTGPKWVGSGRRLRGVPIGERRPLVVKWVAAAEVHRLRGKIRDASCQGGQPPICWVVTAATTWTGVCA